MDVHVQRFGSGPRVLLVHGSVLNGEMTWAEQRPLAERWTLIVPDRRGYVPNPPISGEDFAVDAADIEALLAAEAPVHLVGHSYGGVVALLVAANRPGAVRSLTVVEPPAFSVVKGNAAVDSWLAEMNAFWKDGPSDPEVFLRSFIERVGGSAAALPNPLPPPLQQHARALRGQRLPWEAQIPLAALRAAPFPKLVISGGHSPIFDAACNVLEGDLEAERAVIPGAGHSVPRTGAPFNDRLEQFLKAAEVR